jgi:two-component system LytT family response regulator/two-component system response regulator LytT
MSVKTFVVDDEKPAREEMLWLLEQCEGVEAVGQSSTARGALDALEEHPEVDLLFVDIDMPGIDGMRLAERLADRGAGGDGPLVVFVTAYEDYAVEAFEVDAVDYLLKPVRLERLQKSLAKVRARLDRFEQSEREASAMRPLHRISVQDRDVYRVLPIEEILFFKSEDGIVVAATAEGRYITDFSLKFLEENLDPELFFRSHRSTIVRLDVIESIVPWGAGTYRLIVDRESGEGVPLARSRAGELKSLIPWSATVFEE